MMTKRAIAIFFVLALCTSFLIEVVPIGFAQAPAYLWYRTYGGTGDDEAHCIIRTSDGGYAIAGWTHSFGLTGNRGWLVKTNAAGQIMWNKTYGGSYESIIWSVIQTSDGGYALAGSSVRPVLGPISKGVPWLIKTDSNGNVIWEQTYTGLIGANGNAGAHCIIERPSGGFVLGGMWESTMAFLDFVPAFWIVTDASGNITNSHVYSSGPGDLYWISQIESIIYSGDGGYFLAGSWGGWGPGGGMALWKIDGNGNVVWGPSADNSSYKYGGAGAYSLTRGSDGSLLIVGCTSEWVWDWLNSGYRYYPYIVRVDSSGNQISGSGKKPDTHEGYATAIISTSDGGYVLAGYGKLSSGWDYGIWLLKIDSAENPKWTQTFEFSGDEEAYSMASTTTGGYMVAGFTNSVGAGGEDFLIANFGPALTATITPSSAATYVCNPVAFSSNVTGGTPSYSYQWYLNDTAVSGATSSGWTFNSSSVGYYLVRLRATDSDNTVAWSNIAPMSVGNMSVSIYPILVTMDIGQVQVFSSTITGGMQPYLFKWFLNGSQVSGATLANFTFSPLLMGNYTISLQVKDNASFTTNSNGALAVVNPDLLINISPSSATTIVNNPQTFNSTVSGGTPPYWYEWYANDTLVSGATSENASFTPPQAGAYKIYLNVTDSVSLTNQSNQAWLTVHAPPVANFTWSPLVPMVGDVVTFDGSSSTSDGGTIVGYAWDFGDGRTGSGQIATHVYSAVGNYTVMLNVTDSEGLWNSSEQQIQVIPIPPVNYTLAVNVVGNGSVTVNPLSLSYVSGTNVTLTAVPGPLWTFWNWTGDISGTVIWHDQFGDIMLNQTSIIMDGNKTVTATFGLLGDLNRDGQVNLADLMILAQHWRSQPGDPNWNPLCDMAAPYNAIGLSDVVTLALNYGKHM